MKKIIFFIGCFFCFTYSSLASIYVEPVTFNLNKNFYSEIERSYEEGTIVFNYKNKLLNMDLTDSQLKTILSQKSGNGSSRLAYYETLDIKVNPIDKTPFESLKDKIQYYRANGGGVWASDLTNNQDLEEVASKKNLVDAFWPWGFKIQYRLTPDGTFSSNIPTGKDLNNKTLEEQLATLLDYNLVENPNAVVDSYLSLWRFNPLVNNIFLLRFDFLDEKDGVLPTLKQGTDEYLTSSLNKLGTYKIAIKYSRDEESAATVLEVSNESKNIWFFPICIITFVLGIVCFILKRRLIKF